MNALRVGAPRFMSVRPILFGLMRKSTPEIELVYDEPGNLSARIEQRDLDAALIPSIEYLRGVGHRYLDGMALVAKPGLGTLLLVTKKPIQKVLRIAVNEFCRSPLAVLRIVLAQVHHRLPDICVAKQIDDDWREGYDGILLSGDDALNHLVQPTMDGEVTYNVSEMWYTLTSLPLVLGLWVFDDERCAPTLSKALTASRNLGMQNISHLCDGISQSTQYTGDFLAEYYLRCWDYQLAEQELDGLRTFERYAHQYDLIRHPRLEKVGSG